MKPTAIQIAVPLGILALGLVANIGMNLLTATADRSAPPARPTSVDVHIVTSEPVSALIEARGVVVAQQQIDLVPEVGGRVIELATGLAPGSRLEAGALLARIDPRPYRWNIAAQQSQLAAAELSLALEQKRHTQAQREWELLGDGRPPDEATLALRKPQLVAQEAAFAAAEAALAKARLDLSRTALRAPFDAVVVSESLDLGQVVGVGGPVARLIGTEAVWVDVSVPVHRLASVDVAGFNAERGADVRVLQPFAGGEFREGRVARLAGQLDPATRTAGLLIEVRNPYESTDGSLPLLPGAWVDVEIQGRDLGTTFRVPRRAVVDGDSVWVADAEDTLQRRAIEIAWGTRDAVFVTRGLGNGDRVVTSSLALPVQGMPLAPSDPLAKGDVEEAP